MSRFFIIIGSVWLLFSACKDDKVEDAGQQAQENFLQQKVFGVYMQGKAVFVYQAGEHQLVYTTDGLCCRVQTDSQDKYIAFELSEQPVAGQMVRIEVKARALEGIGSGSRLCQVMANEGGKCWLWEPDAGIGYLLKTGE